MLTYTTLFKLGSRPDGFSNQTVRRSQSVPAAATGVEGAGVTTGVVMGAAGDAVGRPGDANEADDFVEPQPPDTIARTPSPTANLRRAGPFNVATLLVSTWRPFS